MLAGKGFDAERVASTLNALNVQQAFEPLHPLDDTDVEGFLRHEHEMILISAIEEARRKTQDEYESAYERSIHAAWNDVKRTVFDALGQHRVMDDQFMMRAGVGTGSIATSAFTSPLVPSTPGGGRKPLATEGLNRAEAYAHAVMQLNESRLKNRPVSIMHVMEDACRARGKDGASEALARTWSLLATMLGETTNAAALAQATPSSRLYPSMNSGLAEREYASGHLGKPYDDPEAVRVRQRFLSGARQWLETLYVFLWLLKIYG
jgi:nuclear pore complex protein Nup93